MEQNACPLYSIYRKHVQYHQNVRGAGLSKLHYPTGGVQIPVLEERP